MPIDMGTEMRESFEEKNIRFLGYNALKSVTYNDEPVVPQIISEGKDNNGPHFNVEKLGGTDLDDICDDPNVRFADKLDLIQFATNQLKEIDKTGVVLFDRDGRNIRVLAYGHGYISMRQMDLQEYYDKNGGGVYVNREGSGVSKTVAKYEPMGVNMWCESVANLADAMSAAFKLHNEKVPEWIQKYKKLDWWGYKIEDGDIEFAKSDVLSKFQEELAEYIKQRAKVDAEKKFGKF